MSLCVPTFFNLGAHMFLVRKVSVVPCCMPFCRPGQDVALPKSYSLFDFLASWVNLLEIGTVQNALILKNAGIPIQTQLLEISRARK